MQWYLTVIFDLVTKSRKFLWKWIFLNKTIRCLLRWHTSNRYLGKSENFELNCWLWTHWKNGTDFINTDLATSLSKQQKFVKNTKPDIFKKKQSFRCHLWNKCVISVLNIRISSYQIHIQKKIMDFVLNVWVST